VIPHTNSKQKFQIISICPKQFVSSKDTEWQSWKKNFIFYYFDNFINFIKFHQNKWFSKFLENNEIFLQLWHSVSLKLSVSDIWLSYEVSSWIYMRNHPSKSFRVLVCMFVRKCESTYMRKNRPVFQRISRVCVNFSDKAVTNNKYFRDARNRHQWFVIHSSIPEETSSLNS